MPPRRTAYAAASVASEAEGSSSPVASASDSVSAATAALAAAVWGLPHLLQNSASAGSGAPQWMQKCASSLLVTGASGALTY